MKSWWNELQPGLQQKRVQYDRGQLKNIIFREMVRTGHNQIKLSNKELSALTGYPEHRVKRHLAYWSRLETPVFTTRTQRYKHPQFGWCIERTITANPVILDVFSMMCGKEK
jgi:hypothetical protein